MPVIKTTVNLSHHHQINLFKETKPLDLAIEFHPVQNIILFSLDDDFSEQTIKQILIAIRKEIIANYEKQIADDELPFDVLLSIKNSKVKRYTLASIREELAFLESDEYMYAIKLSNEILLEEKVGKAEITALTKEQAEDPKILGQMVKLIFGKNEEALLSLRRQSKNEESCIDLGTILKPTNYPEFIHSWMPNFENNEEMYKFLQQLVNASSKLYIATSKDNIVGAFAVSSSPDQAIHYLSFFVVDRSYRHHLVSADLIKAVIKDLPHQQNDVVFTFYTHQDAILSMLERVGVYPAQARLVDTADTKTIPVVRSLQLKTASMEPAS